jgi:CHAT domain-containing protein/tetratricopeptide (TPR) repeat protein
LREAVDLVRAARRLGDAAAEVEATRLKGWLERELTDYAASRRSLARAARLGREHGLVGPTADVLATRASVNLEQGRLRQARRDIRASRALLEGESSAEIDLQEAILEDASGNLLAAAELYGRVLGRTRLRTPIETRLRAQNNLALVLSQLGRFTGAAAAAHAARALAEQVGRSSVGIVTHNEALIAVRSGRVAEALAMFDRAEGILREVGWPLGEAYIERIEVLMSLNLLGDASRTAERAIAHLERAGVVLLLGEAHLAHGRVLLARGDSEGAERAVTLALPHLRRSRGDVWRARATLLLVHARLGSGRGTHRDAASIGEAIETLASSGFQAEEIDARLTLARLQRHLGNVEAARAQLEAVTTHRRHQVAFVRLKARVATCLLTEMDRDYAGVRRSARAGLEDLDRYRVALPTAELRALASAHGVELAVLGLQSSLVARRPSAVFDWIERGRQASALSVAPEPHSPAVAQTMARLRAVVAQQASSEDESPGEQRRLVARQARLEAEVLRLLRSEKATVPTAITRARAAHVRSNLQDAALISFAVVGQRTLAVCLRRTRVSLHDLGDTAQAVMEAGALAFGLRRLMRARSPASLDAARGSVAYSMATLDALLAAPLARALSSTEEVVVIPTGSLFGVPWHALDTLSSKRVTVCPSASLWLRATAARSDGKVIVAAGPDLAAAPQEVHAIGRLHDGATVLVPPRSTVQAVSDAIDGARLVHLACHGSFRADNPSFSSLQLSDGPLTMLDFEGLSSAPNSVILASCDAGLSGVLPGEELRGFVSALLTRGARSVVASAVPVPDVDTMPLMIDVHARLAMGHGVADALDVSRRRLDDHDPSRLVVRLAFAHFGAC